VLAQQNHRQRRGDAAIRGTDGADQADRAAVLQGTVEGEIAKKLQEPRPGQRRRHVAVNRRERGTQDGGQHEQHHDADALASQDREVGARARGGLHGGDS
jgi:hypothetical protein